MPNISAEKMEAKQHLTLTRTHTHEHSHPHALTRTHIHTHPGLAISPYFVCEEIFHLLLKRPAKESEEDLSNNGATENFWWKFENKNIAP